MLAPTKIPGQTSSAGFAFGHGLRSHASLFRRLLQMQKMLSLRSKIAGSQFSSEYTLTATSWPFLNSLILHDPPFPRGPFCLLDPARDMGAADGKAEALERLREEFTLHSLRPYFWRHVLAVQF